MVAAGSRGTADEGGGQLPEARAHGEAVRGAGGQGEGVIRHRGGEVHFRVLPEPEELVRPLVVRRAPPSWQGSLYRAFVGSLLVWR